MELLGQNVNLILIIVFMLAASLYLATWLSPKGCRHVSLYFFVRAEQLEAGRNAARSAREANVEMLQGSRQPAQAEPKPRRRRKVVEPPPVESE